MLKIVGEPIPGHPELHMWRRASGTRAAIRGTRLEVMDVVSSVQANDGSEAEAAAYFEIEPRLVHVAMRYYRENRELVDGWIREWREFDERELAAWERAQAP